MSWVEESERGEGVICQRGEGSAGRVQRMYKEQQMNKMMNGWSWG